MLWCKDTHTTHTHTHNKLKRKMTAGHKRLRKRHFRQPHSVTSSAFTVSAFLPCTDDHFCLLEILPMILMAPPSTSSLTNHSSGFITPTPQCQCVSTFSPLLSWSSLLSQMVTRSFNVHFYTKYQISSVTVCQVYFQMPNWLAPTHFLSPETSYFP